MCIDNSSVGYSSRDVLSGVKLPDKLSPDLAEILGIILGDGHLDLKKYPKSPHYVLNISGSLSEDYNYYIDEINPMFFQLFNKEFKFVFQRENEFFARVSSKAIATFFKNLGVKPGKKVDNNEIPDKIMNANDEIKKAFLRGVFDTEGSIAFKKNTKGFHVGPTITLAMKSEKFVYQLRTILCSFNFNPAVYFEEFYDKRFNRTYRRHRLELPGKKNLAKFLEVINFRNPRHLTKIEIWNRFGFYPPRLVYQQRIDILNGKLNPNKFYNN